MDDTIKAQPTTRKRKCVMTANVRDQRRRALGAPLADRNPSSLEPVPASGVPTRDDRCIA